MESNPLINSSTIKPLFDFLKKQRENEKVFKTVEIGATFALISFFLFFAVKPTATTISALVGDIKSKEILTKQLKSKINDIISAQDYFALVQERYHVVNASLPDQADFFGAYEQIRQTAADSGLTIDGLDFNLNEDVGSELDPSAKRFSVSLSSTNSFLDAIKFSTNLIQNRRLFGVKGLNFVSSQEYAAAESSDSAKKIGNSFNAIIYYWSPPNEKK